MKLSTRMVLQGIQLDTEDPVDGGAYADIYKSIFNGKPIAVKRFRTHVKRAKMDRKVSAAASRVARCPTACHAVREGNHPHALHTTPEYLRDARRLLLGPGADQNILSIAVDG